MHARTLSAMAAVLLAAGPAAAATVTNKAGSDITIGVDKGASEKTQTVGAGKSVKLDCPEGCGVTGPWGFSWMVAEGDTITSDGSSLVTVKE